MSTTGNHLLGTGLAEFAAYCALPAAVVYLVGFLCHRALGPRLHGVYGEDGHRLRHVSIYGLVAGALVGVLTSLPQIAEDVSLLLAAIAFAANASLITWGARESVSATFIVVSTMVFGCALAATLVASSTVSPAAGFGLKYAAIWPLLALPGFIAASISAFLAVKSTAPAHAEQAGLDHLHRAEGPRPGLPQRQGAPRRMGVARPVGAAAAGKA